MKLIKSKSFKKSLISYIIILILPVIVSGLVYNKAIDIMQNNYIQFSSNNLNYAKGIIEKELYNIEQYILKLSTSPELRKIINLQNPPEGSPDMYWFYEFYKFYNSINIKNTKNKNKMFILINKNNTVFSEGYASFSFKDFYYYYFRYEDLDFEEWYTMYFDKHFYRSYIPEKTIRINGRKENYITLLYTLPIGGGPEHNSKIEAVIAYLFDANELKKMLQTTVPQTGGCACIVDKNNNILVSTNSTAQLNTIDILNIKEGYTFTTINNEKVLAIYTDIANTPWRLISIIPLASIEAELSQFKNISWGILCIAILIGLTVSVFLSYKNTETIRALINLLPNAVIEKYNNNNEIVELQNGIKEIIKDNDQIREAMLRQHDHLRVLYLEKLFRGDFKNTKDLEIAFKHLDLNLNGKYFIVVLVKINPTDQLTNDTILHEQDIFRIALDKILSDASGKEGYTHILNENELALLLSLNDNKNYINHLENIINIVSKSFKSKFAIKPIFSIGNLYDNLLDVHLSLKEARYAADYMLYNNFPGTIIWYKNLDRSKHDQYYYTDEIEQRIVSYTKLGDWNELKLLFNRLYINTIGNKDMSDQLRWILLNDLCATLIKLSMNLEININLKPLDKAIYSKDLDQYYKTLINEYKQICDIISKSKKSHNKRLKDDILKYINENFTNPDLSVTNLAQKFNLSEGYFSQFFKEQTGETFSHYLESLRIEYACRLLVETELSVSEIAYRSGYNNPTTFRRAFKRVKTISPTEYKNANK